MPHTFTDTASPGVFRVLVVEASAERRRLIVSRLAADPQLQVVDALGDAQAALAFLAREQADVVLMDHGPPAIDGFEATRRIMETTPLPIVVCAAAAESDAAFRSLEAGAVACVEKPPADDPSGAALMHLVQTVKLMSEVKVVRRRARSARHATHPRVVHAAGAVGIGASTGGPPVLQTILAELPADFAMPVLVVQHIAPGFLPGMAEWLRQTSGLKVQIAAHGMQALPGHVYLAPDAYQMGIASDATIQLSRASGPGLCPSVAWLFRSLGASFGRQAVGVLLTGMGKDGAAELKQLRDQGAATIVQDRASSVVHGMPGEAMRLGAAMHVLPPERIADVLINLARPRDAALQT